MVGTLDEAIAMQKKDDPNELSEFDLDILGREKLRIEIPFRDLYRVRQAIPLIRGWLELCDFWTRRSDLPVRSILFHLRLEAHALNRKLLDTKAPGRPKKDK